MEAAKPKEKKPPRVYKKCEHDKRIQFCLECGGSSFCQHGRRKNTCIECGGSSICQHGKYRYICKICEGEGVCVHGKTKQICKICGKMCPHNRQKNKCRDCGGSSFCVHNKIKYYCQICDGSSLCIHSRKKDLCKPCGGNGICQHNKRRTRCKSCGGSGICIHDKQKEKCITCTPDTKYFCKSCRLFVVSNRSNYLCSYCNPDKTKNRKTKENRVRDLLTANGLTFIQDKTFTNDCCLKYRPDFFIDCGSYVIIIECDENGHEQYDRDCEIVRMNNISHAIGLPVKWIRYNPDKKGIRINEKEKVLISTIQTYLDRTFLEDLEVVYLFY